MDRSYQCKLDGKISAEFWERNMKEWSEAELQWLAALSRLSGTYARSGLGCAKDFRTANKLILYTLRAHRQSLQNCFDWWF